MPYLNFAVSGRTILLVIILLAPVIGVSLSKQVAHRNDKRVEINIKGIQADMSDEATFRAERSHVLYQRVIAEQVKTFYIA